MMVMATTMSTVAGDGAAMSSTLEEEVKWKRSGASHHFLLGHWVLFTGSLGDRVDVTAPSC